MFDDTLNDHEMLMLCERMDTSVLEQSGLGQQITAYTHYQWRRDLVHADQQLKSLASMAPFLNPGQLIQPGDFGSPDMRLGPDRLLQTLIDSYAVLMTLFQETELGRHYQPSPYASRFLMAFGNCEYLHHTVYHQPPVFTSEGARQTVADLNQRLMHWYQSTKQPDCLQECQRNRRNSRNNYRRLHKLIEALFTCYSRLMVVRIDLGYSQWDGPYIDAETARFHREKLCQAFQTYPLFDHLVGYAWKLEWQPQKGFHYHMLMFWDGHQAQQSLTYGRETGELWAQQITGGQGIYYNCNLKAEQTYQNNATGSVNYYDYQKRQGLDHIARYFTKIDEYAVMLTQGRTFQTSRIPDVPNGPRPGRPRMMPDMPSWSVGDADFP